MIYKKLAYFLVEEDGRCLQVINGVVTATSQIKTLPETPRGWLDFAVSFERDVNMHGIVRSFSVPQEFVGDGRRIVNDAYINGNIERRIFLLIKKLDLEITDDEYQFIYRFLYKGELDLSTIEIGDNVTPVNILEGGLTRLINANKATTKEYTFTDDDLYVKMDGVFLFSTYKFLVPAGNGGTNWLAMYLLTEDSGAPGGSAFTVDGTTYPGPPTVDMLDYFFAATQDGQLTVTATINVPTVDPQPINITFNVLNVNTGVITGWQFVELTPSLPQYTFSHVVNLKEGDRIFSYAVNYFNESTIDLEWKARYKSTLIRAKKPFTLFQDIIEKDTGNRDNASSELLIANENLVVTSGDAIRGIAGAVIKTNLTDFYTSFNVMLNAGLGIENRKVILEAKARFYSTADPYYLGTVKNLKLKPATDLMANSVKIGYPETQIDNVNGKFSFNNSFTYSTVLTRVAKELTLISKYKTDPYAIETARVNLDGKTTTDNSSDNDVVVLNVEPDTTVYTGVSGVFDGGDSFGFVGMAGNVNQFTGSRITISGDPDVDGSYNVIKAIVSGADLLVQVENPPPTFKPLSGITIAFPAYILKRVDYTNDNNPASFGLPSPETAFNIEDLTPARLMKKHGNWLRSLLWKFEATKFKFETTEKNRNLKTILPGETVDEDVDIEVSSLAQPLFIPSFFQFDIDVPVDLTEIRELTPTRALSFSDEDGKLYIGFPWKEAIEPATNNEQSFRLLCAPGNDLSKFAL